MLHALAHIEFGAIDLAFDMAGRFGAGLPRAFVDDWLGVGADEAMHFALLDRRLRALGARYGALPAHDGLWEAAAATAHDLLARLAVVPMVLEARGLDVTPAIVAAFERAGDAALGGDPEPHLPRRDPPRRGRHALVQGGLRIPRHRRRAALAGADSDAFPRDALSRRSTTQPGTKPVCPAISTKGLPGRNYV